MRRILPWLCLCIGMAVLPVEAHRPPLTSTEVAAALPDSIRLKLLAALARGDIPGAIALWQAETGQSTVPRTLQALQAAFGAANRVAGPCAQVAKDIYEGFKFLGGQPEYIRISSTQGTYLSWQSRLLVSDNNLHSAVRFGGKIYDAFVGPAGMLEAEYIQQLHYAGELTLTTVSAP